MTNAGEHIIVELKRARRRLHIAELFDQGNKYRTALLKCLSAQNEHSPSFSIVFVVGSRLYEEDDPGGHKMVTDTLKAINGRVIPYEALISAAQKSYGEYLSGSAKADRIDAILRKII